MLVMAAGCSPNTFACLDDESCAGGPPGGRCEASGFCSFPDDACESGYRYGEFAGTTLANECVGTAEGTGSSSGGGVSTDPTLDPSTTTDASTTSPTSADESTTTTTDASTTSDAVTVGPPTSTTDPSTSTGEAGDDCPMGWWDCAWMTRYPIELDALDLPEAVSELPVPLRLDEAIAADPSLRIVNAAGTVLAHQRDDELVWIRLDDVPANAAVSLYAYVNNPDEDTPPPGEVWDDGFSAVWHFADELDASSNAVDGIPSGVSFEQGVLGRAAHFDGMDDLIEYGAPAALNDLAADGFTIEVWVRPDPTKLDSVRRVFEKTNDLEASAGPGFYLLGPSETIRLEFDLGASGREARYRSGPTNLSDWTHIAMQHDPGGETRMWAGGAELNVVLEQTPLGEILSDVGVPASVGARVGETSASRRYAGLLDELRITRGLRTSAWLLASMRVADATLLSVGEAQTRR